MVITRDYTRLPTLSTRTSTALIQNQLLINHENNLTKPVNLTKNIFSIPRNL
jgi:hypothetical protein